VPIVFFTGFPGFLGSELLPKILRRQFNVVPRDFIIEVSTNN
jgi:hypothetical protein